jgi:hypothetical protein
MVHRNARLTPAGRRILVERVLQVSLPKRSNAVIWSIFCGRPTMTTSPACDSSRTADSALFRGLGEPGRTDVVRRTRRDGLGQHRAETAVDLGVHATDRQVAQGLRALGEVRAELVLELLDVDTDHVARQLPPRSERRGSSPNSRVASSEKSYFPGILG